MATNDLSFSTVQTINVKKGASVATLVFDRRGDGSFSFADVNGNTVRVQASNTEMKLLFDAINALV